MQVLITGISRGIGKTTAEKFLKENWKVIGTSTSGKSNIENVNIHKYKLDLIDRESIKHFVELLYNSGEKTDVLINNSGILIDEGISKLDIDILRKTLEVNLFGLIDLTERILPNINSGGHIINLSSSLGSISKTRSSHSQAYSISKAALNMYTRILSAKVEKKLITVSSIDPGWVKTDMGGRNASRSPLEAAEDIFILATSKVETGQFWHRGKKQEW